MLNASINWPDKWDVSEILGEWWTIAFSRDIQESDINEGIIDKIRKQLLINYGCNEPLIETKRIQFIKSQLIF